MKKSLLNLTLISALRIGFSGWVVSNADKQVLKVPTNLAKTKEKEGKAKMEKVIKKARIFLNINLF